MAVETIPKKILDKLGTGVTVTQATTKTHNVYTFFESLVDNGSRIIANASANNSTATVYTVPTAKVFYLISAIVSFNGVNVTLDANAICQAGGSTFAQLSVNGLNPKENSSISFSIPLKLIAAETITVQSDVVNCEAILSITGYEVDA